MSFRVRGGALLLALASTGCSVAPAPKVHPLDVVANPTTYVFHCPPDKIKSLFLESARPLGEWASYPGGRFDAVQYSPAKGISEGAYAPRRYRLQLRAHIVADPEGTWVQVEGRPELFVGKAPLNLVAQPSSLCCCVWTGIDVNGINPLAREERWAEVPTDAVEEYRLLQAIGAAVGEKGMPQLRVPRFEVIP